MVCLARVIQWTLMASTSRSDEHVSLLQTKAQARTLSSSGTMLATEAGMQIMSEGAAALAAEAAARSGTAGAAASGGAADVEDLGAHIMDQDEVQKLIDLMTKNGTEADPELRITQTVTVNQKQPKSAPSGPTKEDKARSLLAQDWRRIINKDLLAQKQVEAASRTPSMIHQAAVAAAMAERASKNYRPLLTYEPGELANQIMTLSLNASKHSLASAGGVFGIRSPEDLDEELEQVVGDARHAEQNVLALIAAGGMPKEPMPPMGFIKTRRTGASTLASILHRIGNKRDLEFLLPAGDRHGLGWPGSFPGEEAAAFNSAPMHQYDVICNNAVFNSEKMQAYLKPNPLFFTILRRPLAQIASTFDAFKGTGADSWEERIGWMEKLWFLRDTIPSEERNRVLEALYMNPQAHDLGWYERTRGSLKYDFDDLAVRKWIEELDHKIGFVMISEYFNEGLVLLHKKLGVPVSDMAYVMLKPRTAHLEPTAAQSVKMRELLRVDMTLYDHYNRTFWQQWDDAGGYPAMKGDLQQLKLKMEAYELACGENDDEMCSPEIRADDVEFTNYLKKKAVQRAVANSYNLDDSLVSNEEEDLKSIEKRMN